MGREVHYAPQFVPVDLLSVIPPLRAASLSWGQALPGFFNKRTQVDRAEITHIVGEQRLLTAGIGGLIGPQVRHRIVVVGPIDEEHARLAGLPGTLDDQLPDLASPQLAGDLP